MPDGCVFHDMLVQIVQAMQIVAFGVEDFTLDLYIDWVVENAKQFEGVEMCAEELTGEERARSLVAAMLAEGLVMP